MAKKPTTIETTKDATPTETPVKSGPGGWRIGAGRPIGAKDRKKTAQAQEMAAVARLAGIVDDEILEMTPVQIMATAMRLSAQTGDWLTASNIAEKVAQYVTPKLSNVAMQADVKTTKQPAELTDADLLRIITEQNPDKDSDGSKTVN